LVLLVLGVVCLLGLATLRVWLIAIGHDGDEATTAAFTAMVTVVVSLLTWQHLTASR
jgi:hypothetical protein